MIVETEITGPVRNVLLNRPEKRNALNGEMLNRLEEAFSTPPSPDERLAVIRAAGPVFCAGLDLSDHTVTTNPIEDMLHKIETWPLPVVAVVQGDAIAGGNELALHCDIVVASSAARFGMSLAQIGLVPSWFLIKKLLEVAGPVRSSRARADVSGRLSSPSGRTWRIRRSSRPMLTRSAAATSVTSGSRGPASATMTLSLN